ncbi:MAG: RluA family pseudouridine synthase [Candidatus Eisenbacteria bacterium]|nr:RluA family pseudouridine synthase [Candidatus Eisenbacteria bacterium]
MPDIQRKTVPPEEAGKRLDAAVVVLFPGLTRSQAQRLIREGLVTVAGRAVKSSHRLREGDEIALSRPEPAPSALKPENIPLDVLYEDEHLIVVNKPAGMVVHPGAGVKAGTLVNALLGHCADLSGIGGVLRPGIVHRLDKGTSGLIVAAKTDEAHLGLARQIASREAVRKYVAVVWGVLRDDRGRIEAPIGRSVHHRKKMAVDSRRGRRAATRFEVLERFQFATLVSATLETGRTHQVRVHFSHLGHPVFGDPQYGGRTKAISRLGGSERKAASELLHLVERPALHATELSFAHPVTGAGLSFKAEPPSDIMNLLDALRKGDRFRE